MDSRYCNVCERKKGMSACQLQRHLGVNYRTAWHLAHRIREAMQEGGILYGTVEADETYLSPKKPRRGRPYVKKKPRTWCSACVNVAANSG